MAKTPENKTLVREFAGGERSFYLSIQGMKDIESAVGSGIGAVYTRFATHMHSMGDIENVLVQALIGGGEIPSIEARQMVRARMELENLQNMTDLALDVMIASMTGKASLLGSKPE